MDLCLQSVGETPKLTLLWLRDTKYFDFESHPSCLPSYEFDINESSPKSFVRRWKDVDCARLERYWQLLVISLTFFKQIYGIVHPEVARIYFHLSTIYYSIVESANSLANVLVK